MTEWVIGAVALVLLLIWIVKFQPKDPRICPKEGCEEEGSLVSESIESNPLFFRGIVTYNCPKHGLYQVLHHSDEDGKVHTSAYSA